MPDQPEPADQPAGADPAEDRVRAVLRDIARVDLAAAPRGPQAVPAGPVPAGAAVELDEPVVVLELARPPRRRRGRALVALAAVVALVAGAGAAWSRRDRGTPVAAAGSATPIRVVPTDVPNGMSLVAVIEQDPTQPAGMRMLLVAPERRADVQLELMTRPAPPDTTIPSPAPDGPNPTGPPDLGRPTAPSPGSAPSTTFAPPTTAIIPASTTTVQEAPATTVNDDRPLTSPTTGVAPASPGQASPRPPFPTTTVVGEPISDEQIVEVGGGRSVTILARYAGLPLAAQTQIGPCAVSIRTERGTVEDVVAVAELAGCDGTGAVTFPSGRGFDVTDVASLQPTSVDSMTFDDGRGNGRGFVLDVLRYADGVDSTAEMKRVRGEVPPTTEFAGRSMIAEMGGAGLIWEEHGVTLQLSAHALTDAEKTTVIEGLEVVDEEEWQRFAAAAPTDSTPLTGTTMPPPPPGQCGPVTPDPEMTAASVPAGLRLVPRNVPDGWTTTLALYGRSESAECGRPAATWSLVADTGGPMQVRINVGTFAQNQPPPGAETSTKVVSGWTVTFSVGATAAPLGLATSASFAVDGGSVHIFGHGLTLAELEAVVAGLELADEAEWNDVVATTQRDLPPPCGPPECGPATTAAG